MLTANFLLSSSDYCLFDFSGGQVHIWEASCGCYRSYKDPIRSLFVCLMNCNAEVDVIVAISLYMRSDRVFIALYSDVTS